MMLVSVVIPTYIRAASICEAVDSVLQQTRKADEIIVVDDGSTDDTMERLEKYRGEIVVIRQSNQGVSAARNAGVAAATGDWIAFLDSDDIWYPNRLAVLDRDICQTDAGVHVANLFVVQSSYGQVFSKYGVSFPQDTAILVTDNFDALRIAWPPGTAIRKDWFMAVGGFAGSMSVREDAHLFSRLSLLGPWLVTSELVGCVRRREGDTLSLTDQARTDPTLVPRMWVKIHDDLLRDARFPESRRDSEVILRGIAIRASRALFSLAYSHARCGNITESLKSLFASARRHPTVRGWLKMLVLEAGRRGWIKLKTGDKPRSADG